MPFAFFRSKSRRSAARTQSRSLRPLVEGVESRNLMSGVPYMLINSPNVVEGTAPGAPTMMNYTVFLTSPSSENVSVQYQSASRTAVAGSDFVDVGGILTIPAGQVTGTIQVPIVADSEVEPLEIVDMQLSNASNAFLIGRLGLGSIIDDDTAVDPTLSISDSVTTRGMDGSKTMLFSVSLNTTLSYPVSVSASSLSITARAGVDFSFDNQNLVFNPGERTKQVAVTVYGSAALVPDEIFYVALSGASVPLTKAYGAGIIRYGA